ncbi:Alkylhydroperoxidase family enzyme, contains CxxC motif [Arachidicoccus rhizosphaerae]|uniref:Alkylhydroperoxidase family enzyme, contains CxxC motif n=1 Tax=Arachidicoccus rhizosphaerae TaxID=551991 RepID=A0A1H3YCH4_9BACT|nr:carboxymuconolactone decarboxylase family protein [Arachidicoccus rhizosphaerae]SEA09267.1 Alkylhydroperoxidase family enzyme, contains CxxC motif [Arachidicoccus rhizosphaerae]
METRMKNPALILGANPAIQTLMGTIYQSGISLELLEYVGLRVGQLNNCELCIGESLVRAKNNVVTRNRIEYVLTWQTSDAFDEAEKTALELTEAITKLEHKYESVSEVLWKRTEQFFNEKERAALVMFISVMNMFTRINVATLQLTAEWA